MDGANELRIYTGIALPFLRPAWSTLLVFTFTTCWNDASSSLLYASSKTCGYCRLCLIPFRKAALWRVPVRPRRRPC